MRARWICSRGSRFFIYGKLDPVKVALIIREKDEEKKLIYDAYTKYGVNALTLEHVIDFEYNMHIPHNRIHRVMKSLGVARDEPRKRVRKKWVR
jgi:hypothetical protein